MANPSSPAPLRSLPLFRWERRAFVAKQSLRVPVMQLPTRQDVILLAFLSVRLRRKHRFLPPKTPIGPRPTLTARRLHLCEQPSCLEASLCGPSFPNLGADPCSSANRGYKQVPICFKPLLHAEMQQMRVAGKKKLEIPLSRSSAATRLYESPLPQR